MGQRKGLSLGLVLADLREGRRDCAQKTKRRRKEIVRGTEENVQKEGAKHEGRQEGQDDGGGGCDGEPPARSRHT